MTSTSRENADISNFCDRWFKDSDLGTFKSGYISNGDGGELFEPGWF